MAGIRLAEFDAGDFGDGVGVVGGFEGAGEEGALGDGLRGHLGVDAGAAEEEEFAGAEVGGGFDEVVLDGEVLPEEFDGLFVVGEDAADFGGGVDDDRRAFFFEEFADGSAVEEVELGAGSSEDFGVSVLEQSPVNGAADHAAVSGDKYCLVLG